MSYPVNVVEGSVMVWEKNNAVSKELKFHAPRETQEFCTKIIIAATLADDVRILVSVRMDVQCGCASVNVETQWKQVHMT